MTDESILSEKEENEYAELQTLLSRRDLTIDKEDYINRKIGGSKVVCKAKGQYEDFVAIKYGRTDFSSANVRNNAKRKSDIAQEIMFLEEIAKFKKTGDTNVFHNNGLAEPKFHGNFEDGKLIRGEEWCDDGTLEELIQSRYLSYIEKKRENILSGDEIRFVFHNLVKSIKFLNQKQEIKKDGDSVLEEKTKKPLIYKGLFHKDIKPSNILIRYKNHELNVKKKSTFDILLTDYGSGNFVKISDREILTDEVDTTSCGSRFTVDPVLFFMDYPLNKPPRYDQKSEMYSIGATILKAITGQDLFYYDPINKMAFYHLKDEEIKAIKDAEEVGDTNKLEELKKTFTNQGKSLLDNNGKLKKVNGKYLHDIILERELSTKYRIDSTNRLSEAFSKIPIFKNTIIKCMTLNEDKRYKNIDELYRRTLILDLALKVSDVPFKIIKYCTKDMSRLTISLMTFTVLYGGFTIMFHPNIMNNFFKKLNTTLNNSQTVQTKAELPDSGIQIFSPVTVSQILKNYDGKIISANDTNGMNEKYNNSFNISVEDLGFLDSFSKVLKKKPRENDYNLRIRVNGKYNGPELKCNYDIFVRKYCGPCDDRRFNLYTLNGPFVDPETVFVDKKQTEVARIEGYGKTKNIEYVKMHFEPVNDATHDYVYKGRFPSFQNADTLIVDGKPLSLGMLDEEDNSEIKREYKGSLETVKEAIKKSDKTLYELLF